jgi:ADP-dependent phosphofructokinase/glucokinase
MSVLRASIQVQGAAMTNIELAEALSKMSKEEIVNRIIDAQDTHILGDETRHLYNRFDLERLRFALNLAYEAGALTALHEERLQTNKIRNA